MVFLDDGRFRNADTLVRENGSEPFHAARQPATARRPRATRKSLPPLSSGATLRASLRTIIIE